MKNTLFRRALRVIVNRPLRLFGYEFRAIPHAERNKTVWLQRANIHTVLDIGANTGQFAKRISRILPDVKIYSFEPLQECLLELRKLEAKHEKLKVFPFACGEKEEEVEMFRSQYSPSSSLLKMTDRHKQLYPQTKEHSKEKVLVRRLDDIVEILPLEREVLIKIDVQGFEDRVIRGGQNMIGKAKIIVIEASFDELYEGQGDFHTIYNLLYQLGFRFKGFLEQFCESSTGFPTQADAIFMQTDR